MNTKNDIIGIFIFNNELPLQQYDNEYFNVIVCYNSFENIKIDLDDINKIMEMYYKKLKIGGKLYIKNIYDNDNYFQNEFIYVPFDLCISKNELLDIFKNNNFHFISINNNEGSMYDIYGEKVNTRLNNLLTNENTMEHLFKLEHFPVSLSCVDCNIDHNKKLDMIFEICNKTGIIQIKHAPSLNDIYLVPHNSSYGKIWDNLFKKFASMVDKYIKKGDNVLEIGGGALRLASKLLLSDKINKYVVYEKDTTEKHCFDNRIKLVNDYFTSNTNIMEDFDIIKLIK